MEIRYGEQLEPLKFKLFNEAEVFEIPVMEKIVLFLKASKLSISLRIQNLQAYPNYTRIVKWGKLISLTGGSHILVQALGFLSGILIIRLLPVEEYAFYTLANTMLGTMTVLADGGISAGVMSEGGKVWRDKKKLGIVLSTGLDLRKKFAVGSLIVAVPILFYLLMHHNASWLTTGLIIASLIPAFYAALSDNLLQIVPKLHQDIRPLQENQIVVGMGRLGLTVAFLFIFPLTFLAIFASGISRIYGNFKLRRIADNFADYNQKPDPAVRKEIIKFIKRILPGAIYYCISGQLIIWIISIFGSTNSIAEVGALARLTMVLGVMGALVGIIVVPRFARLPDNKKLIKKRLFQIVSILLTFCLMVIGFVVLFPSQVLYILGEQYQELTTELLLITVASCLSLIGSSINNINSSRGIIPSPVFFIPVILVTQILFMSFLDLSVVTQVLWISIGAASTGLIYRIVHFRLWLTKKE